MPKQPDNPLTPEHCAICNEVLASTVRLREFMLKCKDCGLQVDAAIDQNEQHARMAEALKRNFFPSQP